MSRANSHYSLSDHICPIIPLRPWLQNQDAICMLSPLQDQAVSSCLHPQPGLLTEEIIAPSDCNFSDMDCSSQKIPETDAEEKQPGTALHTSRCSKAATPHVCHRHVL